MSNLLPPPRDRDALEIALLQRGARTRELKRAIDDATATPEACKRLALEPLVLGDRLRVLAATSELEVFHDAAETHVDSLGDERHGLVDPDETV